MRIRAIVAALAVIVASCGTEEPSDTTTEIASEETTTTSAAATSTTVAATTTSAPETTIPDVDVEVVGGEVAGPDRFEFAVGDTVDIWVVSDSDDEIHVHGYDLTFDLEAGVPFNLSFDADVPGLFEVESHTGHTLLFEIEVRG
jgi:plastocyanin